MADAGTLRKLPSTDNNTLKTAMRRIALKYETADVLIRGPTNTEDRTLVIQAEIPIRDGRLRLAHDDHPFLIAFLIAIHLERHRGGPSLQAPRRQPNLQVQFGATERMEPTVSLAHVLL